MRDPETGWVEPDITINGRQLTFAEAMAVRVAVSSFRMFACNPANGLGKELAAGYDRQLASVEDAMRSSNG